MPFWNASHAATWSALAAGSAPMAHPSVITSVDGVCWGRPRWGWWSITSTRSAPIANKGSREAQAATRFNVDVVTNSAISVDKIGTPRTQLAKTQSNIAPTIGR